MERNGLLITTLILAFLGSLIYFVIFASATYEVLNGNIIEEIDVSQIPFNLDIEKFLILSSVLEFLSLISIIAIWMWRKWGVYIYVIYTISGVLTGLSVGMSKAFILPAVIIPILLIVSAFSQWDDFYDIFSSGFEGFFAKISTSVVISITTSFVTYLLGVGGGGIELLSVSIGGIVFITVSLLQA